MNSRLRLGANVFCIAFALWKCPALVNLQRTSWNFFSESKLSEAEVFQGFSFEISRFVEIHHLDTIDLSDNIQKESYEYYRTIYHLWPVRAKTGSEFSVIRKNESLPPGHHFFQVGKEVDFARRSQ